MSVELDIPVDGGKLRALRFGEGERLIVAAHGITASGMAFAAVARALPSEWSLIALDLRGRGNSNGLPGPFGMDQHARDICAVTEWLGSGKTVLTGHSMGAYAALRAGASRPDLFDRLVLVDGGLPLPRPEGVDPDVVLETVVGPSITRLRMTFESEESYVEFFRRHPALIGHWNQDVDAYVRYDLDGVPGEHRSKAKPDGVFEDGRDMVVNGGLVGADLVRLRIPTLLMHASHGMFGQEGGLLPVPLVEHWAAAAPGLRTELIPANHFTILLTEAAAATVAQRLTSPWE